MAKMQSIVIASVVLLVMFVQQGFAIRCFECNSHYNSGCDLATVSQNYSVDCSAKRDLDENQRPITYTFCRKISQVIEFAVNQLPSNTRIIRGCGHEQGSEPNTCYKRTGFGGRQLVCSCNDRDFCNSSDALKSTSLLIVSISCIAAYFMY